MIKGLRFRYGTAFIFCLAASKTASKTEGDKNVGNITKNEGNITKNKLAFFMNTFGFTLRFLGLSF